MPTPEDYLRARGLEPLTWDAALRRAEARLDAADATAFARLHRAFTAYPAEHTCRAFYDFAARRGLHDVLACYRFDRLVGIGEAIGGAPADLRMPGLRGARVLDFGAGGGFLAGWMREQQGADVVVTDLSPATEEALAAAGFPLLGDLHVAPTAPATPFDFILCADSLGEIHADEDDWLSDAGNADDADFAGELDARYGFAPKLAALRPLLAAGEGKRGAILLFEPVPLEHFWRGAARLLKQDGWRAAVLGPEPAWGLRLTVST